MRICVFCASSTRVGEPYVSAMRELGTEIARRGHELVFGGYDTGLMGVTAHAVHDAGGFVHGVIPITVGEFKARSIYDADDLREVESLTIRKEVMKDLADAFIAGPGSYGTFDELFEVLVEQKLEIDRPKAVCVFNVNGCYDWLVKRCDEMVEENLVPEPDIVLWHEETKVDRMLDYIENFKSHW